MKRRYSDEQINSFVEVREIKVGPEISQDERNKVDRFSIHDFIYDVPEHASDEKREAKLQPPSTAGNNVHKKDIKDEDNAGERPECDHPEIARELGEGPHDEAFVIMQAREGKSPLFRIIVAHET